MKLLVGIPAYNEKKTIKHVIQSLSQKINGIKKIDILIVDDGSTDGTAKIAQSSDTSVVHHILNRGLGGALKTIFTYGKENNYDILVTFDADGQHRGEDLPRIVYPIVNDKADVVIGTRWKNVNSVPFFRLMINKLANLITYLLFGVWTSDSQSGLRAFGKEAVQIINLQTDGMEVSSEFFREIYRNKLRFVEIPIQAIYTDYSKSKGQKISNAPNVFLKLFFRLLR